MITLLVIGDMHLGRPPTAIPEDLRGQSDALGPQAAWKRAVDVAIDRDVDAVVLAGEREEGCAGILVRGARQDAE